jgi:FixJ family two-component response regulator
MWRPHGFRNLEDRRTLGTAKTLALSRLDVREALFALVLESDRNDGKMSRAMSFRQLMRRQSEVVALLLDGPSASVVAYSLVISQYMAQGYVKSLVTKTTSRDRAEIVGKNAINDEVRIVSKATRIANSSRSSFKIHY